MDISTDMLSVFRRKLTREEVSTRGIGDGNGVRLDAIFRGAGIDAPKLSAKQSEERIPHGLGFVDHTIHGREIDLLLRRGDIDPTTLALQIAAVDH